MEKTILMNKFLPKYLVIYNNTCKCTNFMLNYRKIIKGVTYMEPQSLSEQLMLSTILINTEQGRGTVFLSFCI